MKFKQIFLYAVFLTFTLTACSNPSKTENGNKVSTSVMSTSANDNNYNITTPKKEGDDNGIRVITDIAGWDHPVKKILEGKPFEIHKLELDKDGTYPRFFVKYPDKTSIDDKENVKSILNKIAAANAFWDYSLINEESNLNIRVICDKKLREVTQVMVNGEAYYSKEQKDGNGNNDVLNVPQKYKDYVLKKNTGTGNESILFYAKEDIDMDGSEEVVIAAGALGSEPDSTSISSLYILRDKNGKIEQLGDNLAGGGYGTYEVKLIRLQNTPQKYIYCGLTNGANLRGFQIIELSNNQPTALCYSASATGAGSDEIKDFNNDGQYDGYVQNRWSYDVLYLSLVRTYRWDNGDFILKGTNVSIPEYPDNVKDVIMQYLSLRVLNVKSPEVDKRLSELCKYSKAKNVDFSPDIWHAAVYNTILEIDDKINFEIKEDGNTANVSISFTSEDNKEYKCNFHLTKTGSRWSIDNII
ncbi:MAG: hypothetical protein N2645_02685 [Clostridia bacterium]|nr:hypothetical protein [Clostridia bacterium]